MLWEPNEIILSTRAQLSPGCGRGDCYCSRRKKTERTKQGLGVRDRAGLSAFSTYLVSFNTKPRGCSSWGPDGGIGGPESLSNLPQVTQPVSSSRYLSVGLSAHQAQRPPSVSPRSFNLPSQREMAPGTGPPGHRSVLSGRSRPARCRATCRAACTLSQCHLTSEFGALTPQPVPD